MGRHAAQEFDFAERPFGAAARPAPRTAALVTSTRAISRRRFNGRSRVGSASIPARSPFTQRIYPATHAYCTLGGNIGNNSCGAHTVMGGKTSRAAFPATTSMICCRRRVSTSLMRSSARRARAAPGGSPHAPRSVRDRGRVQLPAADPRWHRVLGDASGRGHRARLAVARRGTGDRPRATLSRAACASRRHGRDRRRGARRRRNRPRHRTHRARSAPQPASRACRMLKRATGGEQRTDGGR